MNRLREKIEAARKNAELRKVVSYLFVGGAATAVEWGLVWLLNDIFSVHHLLATAVAIIISTFANWLFGRLLTFKNVEGSLLKEILMIYLASGVGLLMNLAIMWLLVDNAGLPVMLSKVIATCVVFSYNYLIRRLVIYRKSGG